MPATTHAPSDGTGPAGTGRDRAIAERHLRAIGIACAASVVLLFSSFTLVSRLGLTGEFAVADLASLRFGIGGALLLPVFVRFGLAGLCLAQAASLAAFGGLGFALLAYAGFRLVPSSHAAVLLHGTLPLFGALGGVLLLGQPIRRRTLVGIALVALGIVAMVAARLGTGYQPALGHALLLAASAAWSVYGALVARWRVDARAAAAMVATLSLVAFGTYLLVTDYPLYAGSSSGLALQALFQGVFIGVVSLFLYSQAVSSLGATTVAFAATAVLPVTVVGAIPLLGEWPSDLEWTGLAFALAGMSVALLPSARKEVP